MEALLIPFAIPFGLTAFGAITFWLCLRACGLRAVPELMKDLGR